MKKFILGLALIGVLVGGAYWVYRAASQKPMDHPDVRVLAKVGSVDITVDDFKRNFEKVPLESQLKMSDGLSRLKFLQGLVRTQVMIFAAQKAGYPVAISKDNLANAGRKSPELQRYIEHLGQTEWLVPKSELQSYFTAHKNKWKGQKFDAVAREIELDLSTKKRDAWFAHAKQEVGVQINAGLLDSVKL